MKVLKTMKFKSVFSMSEFLRINQVDEGDIKDADWQVREAKDVRR